jgi:hypothetical protein
MNAQQKNALKHLALLTDVGRSGGDLWAQCSYRPKGTENAILLFQMGVTDADMKQFALLPNWHFINLRESPVSDAGLKFLSNQKNLVFLEISETNITSLNPIKDLRRLKELRCDQLENLTDRKAIALGNFRELQSLMLNNTGIGNATLKRLAGMNQLLKLDLGFTKISDEGLRHVGTLENLNALGLYFTDVSDEGLLHLNGLKQLRLLVVGETNVTEKGKKEIKRAIPKLKVVDSQLIY